MSRPHGLFITGTDTGVGKTVVAAALLAAFLRLGRAALYHKPVQTGARGGRTPDLTFCRRAAGWTPPPGLDELLCPMRLPLAASPHLAAARSGRRLSVTKLADFAQRLATWADPLIVEGAGGLLAPLHAKETMLDLAAALGFPLLIVGRAGLGTLNHTLLTWEAARARGLAMAGIVLNLHPLARPGLIEKDNRLTLQRWTGLKVACLPSLRSAPPARRPALFARAGHRLAQELGVV